MHSSKMWSVLFRIWFGTSLDITSSIRCNSYLPDCTDFFFSFFFANSAHLCEFHLQWSPASQPAKLDRSWRRKLFGRTHKMAASLQIEPREDFFFLQQRIRTVALTFPRVSTPLSSEVDLWRLCYRAVRVWDTKEGSASGFCESFSFRPCVGSGDVNKSRAAILQDTELRWYTDETRFVETRRTADLLCSSGRLRSCTVHI